MDGDLLCNGGLGSRMSGGGVCLGVYLGDERGERSSFM